MKKLALLLTVAAIAVTGLGGGTPSVLAQATGPDVIDPIYTLSLTESINNRQPDAVRDHFVAGGTVLFDNSIFGIANKTVPAVEYAAGQSGDNPDVPADVKLEIVDRSLQIEATRATWTWRQTSGYLTGLNVDYLEFNVVAATENHRFKQIAIAVSPESVARLVSIAPSNESLVRLPYSPALPPLPFSPDGATGVKSAGSTPAIVKLAAQDGAGVKGAAILSATDDGAGSSISLHVTGLQAGTSAQVNLNAGTCEAPSASSARLPELAADTSGSALATGTVLFRGIEKVALTEIADGEHTISISQSRRTVACGVIPRLDAGTANTVGMPRTGDNSGQLVPIMAALLALSLVFTGLRLTRERTLS